VVDVLAVVDREVDHVGNLADRHEQAGARRGAIDENLVSGRLGGRDQVPQLGLLALDPAGEPLQQADCRRRIGRTERTRNEHGPLPGDESHRAPAEYIAATVTNLKPEARQHVFRQGRREVVEMLFPEDGRTSE
jgi:hypothetical protein